MSQRPKKRYGQHFLKSSEIAFQIANFLDTSAIDGIVEVGPGRGMLSQFLFDRAKSLYLIEADIEMVEFLENRYAGTKASIIHEDFLKSNLDRFTQKKHQIGVIGNFPYNISSQIIFKCLDYSDFIPEIVGMFQFEMAKRIVAPPGKKDYGIISVLTQIYYEGEILLKVSAEEFSPPPRVESAVIKLNRKSRIGEIENLILLKKIVKTTFGQRRKMIRNTLKGILPENYDTNSDFFNKRPEQLSVSEFIDLSNRIYTVSDRKKE